MSNLSFLLLFLGLMLIMLMSSLNQNILAAALPTVVGELDGVQHMSWVMTSTLLASTIMMPIYGKLSDQFGRKPLLLVAITFFVAGSIVGGLALNIWWLILSRVLQGMGAGGLMILSQATIADAVPARSRAKYLSLMGAVFSVASLLGPLVGGWLTEGPGWRWAFLINIPLGIISILVTIFLVRPKTKHFDDDKPVIDYAGMAMIAITTTMIVLIFTWGGHIYAWNSVEIIALSFITVLLGILFVTVEIHAKEPIVPMWLFRERNFTLTTLASVVVGLLMLGAIAYFPTYIQMVHGVSAVVAGLMMTPMMLATLITSIVAGWIVSATGRYKIFPIAGVVVIAISLALMGTLTPASPAWAVSGSIAVLGVGLGLIQQVLVVIVQNSFDHAHVGTATASSNFFRQIGGTVGSAVVGSLFVSRLGAGLRENFAPILGIPTDQTDLDIASFTPEFVHSELPPVLEQAAVEAYNEALLPIYLWMIPLALISLVLLFFVKEYPLKTTLERGSRGGGGGGGRGGGR